MKFGMVLPSWLYDDERKRMARETFATLAKSDLDGNSLDLMLIIKGQDADYGEYIGWLQKLASITVNEDEGLTGTEQPLAYGTEWLFANKGVDYVIWMGDDALFNSGWLVRLEALIARHMTAKAWSVYRSNHEKFHAPLQFTGDDVLVKSICGHGMTFSKKEWSDWGVRWEDHGWEGMEKMTLDLVHAKDRDGERWVTKQSYIEHTGWRSGRHCTGCEQEYAKEFQR